MGEAPLETRRYQLGTLTLIETVFPDRRLASAPVERWLFTAHCGVALYNSMDTGAFMKLLGRCATGGSGLGRAQIGPNRSVCSRLTRK